MFENKTPKTEKPRSNIDKLKRLSLAALVTTSMMSALDTSDTAFSKPTKNQNPFPPNMIPTGLDRTIVTHIDPSIVPSAPQYFHKHINPIDFEKGITTESLTFNPYSNNIIMKSLNYHSFNGTEVSTIKTYPAGALKSVPAKELYNSGLTFNTDSNGRVGGLAGMVFTPIQGEGVRVWNNNGMGAVDLSSSKDTHITTDDMVNGGAKTEWGNHKILKDGILESSGKQAYYISKHKKISPEIKKIDASHVKLWDIDSLEVGGKISTKFEGSVIEFYNPEIILHNVNEIDKLRANCQGCTIVLFTNPKIDEKRPNEEYGDEGYLDYKGGYFHDLEQKLEQQMIREYNNFLAGKPIGPEVESQTVSSEKYSQNPAASTENLAAGEIPKSEFDVRDRKALQEELNPTKNLNLMVEDSKVSQENDMPTFEVQPGKRVIVVVDSKNGEFEKQGDMMVFMYKLNGAPAQQLLHTSEFKQKAFRFTIPKSLKSGDKLQVGYEMSQKGQGQGAPTNQRFMLNIK
jgi:hypothetical protein